MPAPAPPDAPLFSERLRVPWRWWVVAAIGVGIGGAEIFAGFTWDVALGVYVAVTVPVVAVLVGIGRARVCVDARGLHAGGRTLPLDQIASATPLEPAQTRHRLGPGGDPAAHLVTRGFIRTSVLVRPLTPAPVPYWLVSSRHPHDLAAVLDRARALTG